ncbi:CDP-glycerol glycerophosphotransferase family protein [uncultured Friedmanniella sp.]|uniref:CDP-glycerol glycerophosphotransferase family protein n=1 Tax=uncultured Friedmanniella sp. TaxID=335381 RepID=UPI0035C97EF0
MKIVYDSFEGRYSDNPRALYERWSRANPTDEHVWRCDPRHADSFPAGVSTVPVNGPETRAALEQADLIVANSHLELDWDKKPGAVYLQTWHGTPLKRIHNDVLWAPEGVLANLDRDVARWDYLLSPNAESTPRLRDAFGFTGEILEVGYPRNDILSSPDADEVRAQVRASLGIADDVTAVLYTPTWRDDEFYADGTPNVELALDVDDFIATLGPTFALLPRLHYKVTHRADPMQRSGVVDVSRYADAPDLYLAADVMITDYSSTMFDFAITAKPLIFFAYDLESYRDSLRGFYFDLEPLAPGPVLRTSPEVIAALQDLDGLARRFEQPHAEFRRLFSHREDGHAGDRLQWVYDTVSSRQPQLSGRD